MSVDRGRIVRPSDPDFWDPEVFAPMGSIRTNTGMLAPLHLWAPQRILAAAVSRCYRENRWLVHAKARQEGSSTFFTMIATQHAAFRLGCRAAILAHKKKTAGNLAEIAIRYHRTLPPEIRPAKLPGKKRSLEFPELDSSLDFYSVQDDEPLRGNTVQVLLATEISSWGAIAGPDAWTSALSAVSDEGGFVIAESTPKHDGDELHQLVIDADKPDSRWLKVFIPWTMIPKYAKPPPPGWRPSKVVYDYANAHKLTVDQAYWMQAYGLEKVRHDLVRFRAEYPIDEDDCFVVSGDAIFDTTRLLEIRRELDGGTNVLRETNPLEEFVAPHPEHRYVINVDPASGFAGVDLFGVEVLDLFECEQVAEFHGHKEAYAIAKLVGGLSDQYNEARIYVEANGVGEAVISHLVRLGYQRRMFHRAVSSNNQRSDKKVPGWWSSDKFRTQALSFLQEALLDGSIVLHSLRLVRQLLAFRDEDKQRDESGGHFDLVLALAQAVWAWKHEGGARRVTLRLQTDAERAAEQWRRLQRLTGSHSGTPTSRFGVHR